MVKTGLWRLANTTIRNPERLPGALAVFIKKYDGGKSFEKNQMLQVKLEKDFSKYTENGDKITKDNELPIVEYSKKAVGGQMLGKNGRMWLSIMDDYGFTNSYNKKSNYENKKKSGKAYATDVGNLFVTYPLLRNEIWLKQILKWQFPHYKKQPTGIQIRGGWWFLKLITEFDGLTKFEIGIAILSKNEDFEDVKKKIDKWRKEEKEAKKKNGVTELEEKWQENLLSLYFEDVLKEKEKYIIQLVKDVKKGATKGKKIQEYILENIVNLGKGSATKRAKVTCDEIEKLLKKSCYQTSQHIDILKNYFSTVKSDVVWGDYVDANSRILKMTGIINWIPVARTGYKYQFQNRLKISDEHFDMVKNAVENCPCLFVVDKKNANSREKYYEYLVDMKRPHLKTDDDEFLMSNIQDMEKKIQLQNKSIPKPIPTKLLKQNKLRYYQLQDVLRKDEEEDFIRHVSKNEIIKELQEMIKTPKDINPITLESVIWKAVASFGGYKKHISETRNFGLDMKFNQIFTAGGDMPDMQFHYDEFDEVIEVTKMGANNKGQLTGEFVKTKTKNKPVPEHVAEHAFYNNKKTYCLFIAPDIHPGSLTQCYSYSCKKTPHAVTGNFMQKKVEMITFNIVPLTLKQFLKIFQVCSKNSNSAKEWIKIISVLHNIQEQDEKLWINSIANYIKKL